MNQLTETPHGLQKEHGGVLLAIQHGANLGITIRKLETGEMLTSQLDKHEVWKLICYAQGDKTLKSLIKDFQDLNAQSLDRTEELRNTIKALVDAARDYNYSVRDGFTKDECERFSKKLLLEIEKAKKQLD